MLHMREKLKIIPLTKNSSFLFNSALAAKFGSGAALVASDASYGNITTVAVNFKCTTTGEQ